ncbi:helix-turn-helix domain-containing protein [Tenacibaculum sp. SSH1-16]|uniref:helix-turn-helix domain-containing protein n=1 Tax=unclassified Tenacibaculum TaxID=2635139 RepID=UPI0012E62363|nr:helix-turn-helix domain-containing protein [Tenacibaculum sp. XPcli2-G]MCO7185842.1 helix-turn-helix domain-containing protein [Tenacibaculum sp. XPcli2-G]BFF37426.1 helix-turn-helix domain-containing protein [Tenacibaculum mesophilum]GFD83127.1 transcriptional regulator [Tenacibaculum sp. KUL118]
MLKTIQIAALLQGMFLLFILFQRKKEYNKVNFWLLFSFVVSALLFTIGDDNYNLFTENSNWFFFHEPLIITTFFLFVHYHKSDKKKVDKKVFLFFTPYLLNILIHFSEEFSALSNNLIFIILEEVIEFIFIGILIYTIYDIIKNNKEKWLLFFIIPFSFIFIISEFNFLLTKSHDAPYFLDSYGTILIIIFLFYFVLYKLIITPKSILPKHQSNSYKSTNLNNTSITHLKAALHRLIVEEKWFKYQKITVDEVAKELGVPRQQISEVLNIHMKTGFQDFLNKNRVEEFITCLKKDSYKNYTLLAIAYEVGFSSKSSFNTIFKKLKGITPSQYKKLLNIQTSN